VKLPGEVVVHMALSPLQKVFLVAGFLITGSINTLTKKWQLESCGPTVFPASPDEQQDCPAGQKEFRKPWTQNIVMFFGEALVITIFLARAPSRARAREQIGQSATRAPFYIFALSACLDILGSGIGGVGMMYISASVWQVMRGSLLIFVSLLTPIFLRNSDGSRRMPKAFNWVAVLVVASGLLLVGMSAIIDDSGETSTNVPLGILLTVVAQLFEATKVVFEELFVNRYNAPPEQVVGSEGLWGILVMCIVLAVMYAAPGGDAGSYENVVDSLHMMAGSGRLLALLVINLFSISFFNFFGVTISGELSAVTRTVNDAMRTMIIWTVEIIVFYGISEKYGQEWQPHSSYLELIGFLFLITGNMINSKVLRLPCFRYDEVAPTASNNSQISLKRQTKTESDLI
jgi:predicted membrane protein